MTAGDEFVTLGELLGIRTADDVAGVLLVLAGVVVLGLLGLRAFLRGDL